MALSDDFRTLSDAMENLRSAAESAAAVASDNIEIAQPVEDAVQALLDIAQRAGDSSASGEAAADAADRGDLPACGAHLGRIHADLCDIGEAYEDRVSTLDVGAELDRIRRRRGIDSELKDWHESVRQYLDDIVAPFDQVNRAVHVCWRGLTELLSQPLRNYSGRVGEPILDNSSHHLMTFSEHDYFTHDYVIPALEKSAASIDTAKSEFTLLDAGIRATLEEFADDVEEQREYVARTDKANDVDDGTLARQLRSFFGALASALDGTRAFATDELAHRVPPPTAALTALADARDVAWTAAEDFADHSHGGTP
jgi:hypothetical protein